jgi:hypothetical protein
MPPALWLPSPCVREGRIPGRLTTLEDAIPERHDEGWAFRLRHLPPVKQNPPEKARPGIIKVAGWG